MPASHFNNPMRVIPVLDLQGGVVVRGIGGRRHEYRPVVSRLMPSCHPPDVARAFRGHFGLTELYVADLDALAGAPPDLTTYALLHGDGFRLWVDAGVRDAASAEPVVGAGVARLVVGLETVAGPAALADVCRRHGDRVVFSLDLKDGVPLGDTSAWPAREAWDVAARALDLGVRRLLLLDLARVGGGGGTGTEELCARVTHAYPGVEVAAGGGVRGADDLSRLKGCGVSAVLVASALHDGALGREDLERLLR